MNETTQLVCHISDNIIANNPSLLASQKRLNKYNIACWLNIMTARIQGVKLILNVQDQSKEQQIIVDTVTRVESESVLLSGQVSVNTIGPILKMSLLLASDFSGLSFEVENAYIERAMEIPSRSNQQEMHKKVS